MRILGPWYLGVWMPYTAMYVTLDPNHKNEQFFHLRYNISTDRKIYFGDS